METPLVAPAAMPAPTVIARARAGDPAAFAAIYAAYYPRIVACCRRIVGDPDLAEDLAQDTFIKAYRALPRTTPDLPLAAWLFRIAGNTALSALRRRRRLYWLPLFDFHAARPGFARHGSGLLKLPRERRTCHSLPPLRRLPQACDEARSAVKT